MTFPLRFEIEFFLAPEKAKILALPPYYAGAGLKVSVDVVGVSGLSFGDPPVVLEYKNKINVRVAPYKTTR
jgi:hypothetical protein